MKKFFSLLACAASVCLAASCSESEENDVIDNQSGLMSFVVATPSSSTRAEVRDIDSQNPAVDWQNTDKIFVWGAGSTTTNTFTFQEFGNYHNYAKFTGKCDKAEKYYIMYPNQSGASFDGNGNISATIPQYQKAVDGSFDPAAAILTGATQGDYDVSVSILHACAFLKITTTKPCYSVTVTAAGDDSKTWNLTGGVTIETSSSASKITAFPGGVTSVVLNASGTSDCSSTFPAGTYLMAIAPSTRFPGIHVKVDYEGDNDPEVTNAPSGGIQFNAAYIYNLGTAAVATEQLTEITAAAPGSNPNNAPTRAEVRDIESQNPAVDWQNTDKIFVWGAGSTTTNTFTFKEFGNYHNYATFSGSCDKAEKYYIMYPNQSGASFDGNGNISATIPQYQKAVDGSFDPAAAILTGATQGDYDVSVSILHACAFLKITTSRACNSVTVTAAGDDSKTWNLTGGVTIETSSSASKITAFPDGKTSVVLNATGTADCSTSFPAGTYLMAIAPSTRFPGIKITVDFAEGEDAEVSNAPSGGIQFNAAYIYNIGDPDHPSN